jgi:hypothetical protein
MDYYSGNSLNQQSADLFLGKKTFMWYDFYTFTRQTVHDNWMTYLKLKRKEWMSEEKTKGLKGTTKIV